MEDLASRNTFSCNFMQFSMDFFEKSMWCLNSDWFFNVLVKLTENSINSSFDVGTRFYQISWLEFKIRYISIHIIDFRSNLNRNAICISLFQHITARFISSNWKICWVQDFALSSAVDQTTLFLFNQNSFKACMDSLCASDRPIRLKKSLSISAIQKLVKVSVACHSLCLKNYKSKTTKKKKKSKKKPSYSECYRNNHNLEIKNQQKKPLCEFRNVKLFFANIIVTTFCIYMKKKPKYIYILYSQIRRWRETENRAHFSIY